MIEYREKTLSLREKIYSSAIKNYKSKLTSIFFKKILKLKIWEFVFKKYSFKINLEEITFQSEKIPKKFNNYKILFISDFHFDIKNNPIEKFKDIKLPYHDIIIFGGDYFDKKNYSSSERNLEFFIDKFKKPIYAVLGNHDGEKVIKKLESKNVNVLINKTIEIKNGNEKIILCGIDDLVLHNTGLQYALMKETQKKYENDFKLLISHTPDAIENAQKNGFDVQLSGHTHGGQFKLFNYIHFSQTIYNFAVHGKWKYKNLQGYTTSGFGNSGYPIRNIYPEMVIVKLKNIQ